MDKKYKCRGQYYFRGSSSGRYQDPYFVLFKEINQLGACRVCLVEIEKVRGLKTACVYPVAEGMVVRTNTAEVRKHVKL